MVKSETGEIYNVQTIVQVMVQQLPSSGMFLIQESQFLKFLNVKIQEIARPDSKNAADLTFKATLLNTGSIIATLKICGHEEKYLLNYLTQIG